MSTKQEATTLAAARESVLSPAVDVIEDAEGITLYADLPGVPKDKLELTFEAGALTIAGTIELDAPADLTAGPAEIALQRYRRVFALSKELDGERAAAELAHGVLTLRIPKAAHALPRRIEVRVP